MTILLSFPLILALSSHRQAIQYIDHKQYAEAAKVCRQALAATEHDSLEAALLLRDLARAYRSDGYLNHAQAFQRQQIEILRTRLGENDANVAVELDRLGEMIYEQGKFSEAAKAFQQALRIAEISLDADSPYKATILNDLGAAFQQIGHRSDAAKLYRRSLAIRDSAVTRGNMARLERTIAAR